jgi:hypothetical protein
LTRTKKKVGKIKTKIIALVVSALILVTVVPAVSAAPSVVQVPAPTAGPYEEAYGRYIENLQAFQTAHTDWLGARATFLDTRLQWRQNRTQANLANLVEKAKISLLRATEMMIKRLQLLWIRVEISRGLSDEDKAAIYAEIDDNISWLQAKQAEILAAQSMGEIRSIADTIWSHWREVRVWIKQITGQILIARVDALVQKAEAFKARVEARIQELKDNGVDTSTLEAMLAECDSNLTLAKQKYDAAEEKFGQISSEADADVLFAEGVSLIRQGNVYIREVFRGLRDIVLELRSMGRTVTLTGSGSLVAHGSGSAYLSGTGLADIITIQNGVMTVSSNVNVESDVTGENLENGEVKYEGFSHAKVTGTDITVSLSGSNITLYASGTGTVVLTGNWIYRSYGEDKYMSGTLTENMDGALTETYVTVTLATGDVSAGVA